MTKYIIHSETMVCDLIRWLQTLDPEQKFLPQAIAPSGEAWSVPAVIKPIPTSGKGLPYLGIQMRCEPYGGQI